MLSNKRDEDVQSTIRRFLPDTFDIVYGVCSDTPRKPNPQGLQRIMSQFNVLPQKTICVGDSAGDILVAHAAGTFSAAVNYGYGTNGNISQAQANVTLTQFNQILSL